MSGVRVSDSTVTVSSRSDAGSTSSRKESVSGVPVSGSTTTVSSRSDAGSTSSKSENVKKRKAVTHDIEPQPGTSGTQRSSTEPVDNSSAKTAKKSKVFNGNDIYGETAATRFMGDLYDSLFEQHQAAEAEKNVKNKVRQR